MPDSADQVTEQAIWPCWITAKFSAMETPLYIYTCLITPHSISAQVMMFYKDTLPTDHYTNDNVLAILNKLGHCEAMLKYIFTTAKKCLGIGLVCLRKSTRPKLQIYLKWCHGVVVVLLRSCNVQFLACYEAVAVQNHWKHNWTTRTIQETKKMEHLQLVAALEFARKEHTKLVVGLLSNLVISRDNLELLHTIDNLKVVSFVITVKIVHLLFS